MIKKFTGLKMLDFLLEANWISKKDYDYMVQDFKENENFWQKNNPYLDQKKKDKALDMYAKAYEMLDQSRL